VDVNSPIFEPAPDLPRGPHDLSREEVSASQVTRLSAAIAGLVAEHGYPQATIAGISRRAGVSRATFYECYTSKEACYLAAYLRFGAVLSQRMAEAATGKSGFEELVDAVLTSYLGTLDADPAAARAFVLEIDGAGLAARAEGRRLYAQMAALAEALHGVILREDPALHPLAPEAYVALVHGVRGLVRDVLDTNPSPHLLDLLPSLRAWIGAIIRGA
jgi:AcrR family transcriptional regulator